MAEEKSAQLEGSGAIAQDHSAAAGERGIANTGNISQSPIIPGDHNVVTVIYQGHQVSIPSSEAITAHRAALRDRLEKEALQRWGGMSIYIQEEGAALPIEASPYETGRLGPRENLLRALHSADRLLVLGEAGSGKTVALERFAWELCAGEEPTIPVLVRLFHFAGTSLAEWVRAILQETGHLRLDDARALAAFLKASNACCFLLFDGLNEVPPPYRDRLIDELVRWMAAYPRHPVLLTSRGQDELWRRLRQEVGRAVVVQPISDEQACEYLIKHMGKPGEELYERLGQRLREMAGTPLILWLIKMAGEAGESVPGNRGELYTRFVSRMLRRDTDRRMDAEIPERIKCQALADLAYHLSLGQKLSCDLEEAVLVVAKQFGENLAEKVVGACQRHGLLAGETTIWFAPHQTVQEHFTAQALRDMVGHEAHMSRWTWLRQAGRRLMGGQSTGLAALAADDWWMEIFVQLAGLTDDADWLAQEVARINPWLAWWCVEEGREVSEETHEAVATRSVRLLESDQTPDRRRAVAALARMRNERVVHSLFRAAADPDTEVAALAVQALTRMGEAARSLLESALAGTNRRQLFAALRYFAAQPDASPQIISSLFKAATDPDAEVGKLAVQALLTKDETVRGRALELAQQPENVLHRAGLAYLEGLLGLPVVWVPPGPFWMGSDKVRDPRALDCELPRHRVVLSGYWIACFPTTVGQFRAFEKSRGAKRKDLQGASTRDDHPAIGVIWDDAVSFCSWLSDKTKLVVKLPSEPEWEKAARGTDERIYPWGNKPPSASRCNFGMTRNDTTRVGSYSPEGDSPYGCADMAGNIWEWTRSIPDKYPYDPEDGREDLDAKCPRVLRGGAFFESQELVRCACRHANKTFLSGRPYGFRIIVVPP